MLLGNKNTSQLLQYRTNPQARQPKRPGVDIALIPRAMDNTQHEKHEKNTRIEGYKRERLRAPGSGLRRTEQSTDAAPCLGRTRASSYICTSPTRQAKKARPAGQERQIPRAYRRTKLRPLADDSQQTGLKRVREAKKGERARAKGASKIAGRANERPNEGKRGPEARRDLSCKIWHFTVNLI